MTPEKETNKIYFSDWIKRDFPSVFKELKEKLEKHNQAFELLENTKDYWARDYMPIQVTKDRFVQYKYFPDYLIDDKEFISDSSIIWRNLGFKHELKKTDLVLDGGNIVKSKTAVILTDKIFIENKNRSKVEIIQELKMLFELDRVVIIPWDKNEKFGHSDGMLRFIDDDTVLINSYFKTKNYSNEFQKMLYGNLEKNNIKWVELKYEVEKENENLNWAYINFLITEKVLLVPKFGIPEDKQAFEQIKKHFPNQSAEQIDMNEVSKGGGALNCISWTIEE